MRNFKSGWPPAPVIEAQIRPQNRTSSEGSVGPGDDTNRVQPIAGFWPVFRMARPEKQLLGFQGLATMAGASSHVFIIGAEIRIQCAHWRSCLGGRFWVRRRG